MRPKIAVYATLAASAVILGVTYQSELRGLARNHLVELIPESSPLQAEEIQAAALSETEAEPSAAELDALNAAIAERDGVIGDLRAALAERDSELDRLAAALVESEEQSGTAPVAPEIAEAEAEAEAAPTPDYETRLAELTDALAERDAELAALRDELSVLRENAGINAELASLKAPQIERTEEFAILRSDAARFEADLAAAKAAAPAGPEPAAAPAKGPLTEVHFESASARLTPGARIRAREAAEKLSRMEFDRVRIAGHTDRVGDPANNRALSRARAEAVADILVEAGLAREMIEITGLGETLDMLPISTEDGISEPLNRCVGIFAVLDEARQATAN